IAPTRRPMRLPKIAKYSTAVTTDGTMVWPQMRMMRPYSRMTMVLKPIQRTTLRRIGGGAAASTTLLIAAHPRSRRWQRRARRLVRRAATLHELHEDLLQAVDLVAHAEHLDAECREPREDLVEVLLLRHLDLEGVIVDERDVVALERRWRRERVPQVEDERLDVQPPQETAHAVTLDDAAAVDDGN